MGSNLDIRLGRSLHHGKMEIKQYDHIPSSQLHYTENNTGYEYPTGLSADYEQAIELTRELSVYFMT